MLHSGSTVAGVTQPSPASRAGLKKGDIVISCNGEPVKDWVDLLACSSAGNLHLTIRRGLSEKHLSLRRRPGASWGITLSGSRAASCGNRCIFCFVDQQPPGLRETLMVKDDDIRYSFIQGTYVTLTDKQAEEAIERGFNSVHVSVHTTDPVLRGKMLGRGGPMPILPMLRKLDAHGTEIHTQIVEVPRWNNGEELSRTISDLYAIPAIRNLGVVPVGLTRWRKGRVQLRRHTPEEAWHTLEIIGSWQRKAMAERGFPWVFAADEYYLMAGEHIPPADLYAECALQANGIGLLAAEALRCVNREFKGRGTVVTGVLAFPFVKGILSSSKYRVLPVVNRLMGPDVGVSGLLAACDVIDAVGNCPGAEEPVFLPPSMFNHRGLSLDDLSPGDTARELGMRVIVPENLGELT